MKKIKAHLNLLAVLALLLMMRTAHSQCSASFSVSQGPNGAVTFVSTSTIATGTIVGYVWNFSNGYTTSGSPIISYTFNANGIYTVTLSFTTSVGCSTIAAQQVTITNVPTCTLTTNFTYTTNPSNGLVFFNSTSSGSATTVYTWNFGDGSSNTTTTATPVSHTYTANGTYTVLLTATSGSCSPAFNATVITFTSLCTLVPTFNLVQGSNGSLTLINTTTGTTAATTYSIYWGDGTFNGPNPHTYTANNFYAVSLTAFGNIAAPSCSPSLTQTVPITSVCSLQAGFTFTTGTNGNVFFNNTSVSTSTPTTYFMKWGDGSSSAFNTLHQYTTSGAYSPTLYAFNTASCQDSINHPVFICNLSVNFSLTPGSNGHVLLTDLSIGTTTTTVYNIAWGDNTYNGANPHQYTANGNYTVSVSASNTFSAGTCSDSVITTISVTNFCPPMAAHFIYTVNANGHVSFSSTSTGTTGSTTYSWSYSLLGSTLQALAISGPTGSITFTANNSYYISLSIFASPTCSSTTINTFVINNVGPPPCNVSFTYSMTGLNTFSFNSQATGTTSGTQYHWHFGDSTSAYGSSAVHSYTSAGMYYVYLSVADSAAGIFCNSSVTLTFTPVSCTLVSGFSHTVGDYGSVDYESTSTGTTVNSFYFWDFGDGYTGTGPLVNHTYLSEGAYMLTLVVTNGFCTDTLRQSVNVTGAACHANAHFTLSPVNAGQHWDLTPAYPWNVSEAAWSWGDGSTSNTLYSSHTYSLAGTYTICLTVILECGDTATYCAPYSISRTDSVNGHIQINVTAPVSVPAGIAVNQAETTNYSIYPNPNSGEFTIRLTGALPQPLKFTIYNSVGDAVFEIRPGSASEQTVCLKQFPEGIYFIRSGSGSTKKLIISSR